MGAETHNSSFKHLQVINTLLKEVKTHGMLSNDLKNAIYIKTKVILLYMLLVRVEGRRIILLIVLNKRIKIDGF